MIAGSPLGGNFYDPGDDARTGSIGRYFANVQETRKTTTTRACTGAQRTKSQFHQRNCLADFRSICSAECLELGNAVSTCLEDGGTIAPQSGRPISLMFHVAHAAFLASFATQARMQLRTGDLQTLSEISSLARSVTVGIVLYLAAAVKTVWHRQTNLSNVSVVVLFSDAT